MPCYQRPDLQSFLPHVWVMGRGREDGGQLPPLWKWYMKETYLILSSGRKQRSSEEEGRKKNEHRNSTKLTPKILEHTAMKIWNQRNWSNVEFLTSEQLAPTRIANRGHLTNQNNRFCFLIIPSNKRRAVEASRRMGARTKRWRRRLNSTLSFQRFQSPEFYQFLL